MNNHYSASSIELYMEKVANNNYLQFFNQGYATAGHNGPHGHSDTPARNTAHYLVIYSYLYKKTRDEKYLNICHKFVDYLVNLQKSSQSGAIECMTTDRFDHLNGLIGQGWVIEGLMYYYSINKDPRCLNTSLEIFYSQKYDWNLHLWHRIELDGRDIDIDPTYNHQFWFAACSSILSDYCNDTEIEHTILDFINESSKRDFRIYKNGLQKHYCNVKSPSISNAKKKRLIKYLLTPIRWYNPKKLDPRYQEYGYHLFDLYGWCILQERYPKLDLFKSDKYLKAVAFAKNIDEINNLNGVEKYLNTGKSFNIYGYSYNCPTFEWPFIAKVNGFANDSQICSLYETLQSLMWEEKTGQFSKNQPDIDTWNARTYEIIRYLDKI